MRKLAAVICLNIRAATNDYLHYRLKLSIILLMNRFVNKTSETVKMLLYFPSVLFSPNSPKPKDIQFIIKYEKEKH